MICYLDNDHLIRLEDARAITLATGEAAFLTGSATVTVTLFDDAGVPVSGQTWPLALSYVAGSEGVFLGVLQNEVVLVEGESYILHAEITAGANQYAEWDMLVLARVRR